MLGPDSDMLALPDNLIEPGRVIKYMRVHVTYCDFKFVLTRVRGIDSNTSSHNLPESLRFVRRYGGN